MIRRSGRLPGYRWRCCVQWTLASLLLATAVLSQPPGPEQRVAASDPDNFDRFGAAVDVWGPWAVIGAPGDDEEGTNAGAAYVFRYANGSWSETQKLTASLPDDFDEFGFDVSVERDLIAVGARWDDDVGNDAGAVYLFEWNGTTSQWEETQKFLPTAVSVAADAFGTAVDLGISIPDEGMNPEQTVLGVGAPFGASARGTVYLLRRVSDLVWDVPLLFEPEAAPDPDECDNQGGNLGNAIAVRGDSLLAGAPQDDQTANNAGSACHFGRGQIVTSWVPASRDASPPVGGEVFGDSVAVTKYFNEYIEVYGAPHASANGDGRILIQDVSGLHPLPVAGADDFGKAVAIDGLQVAVGAPKDDTGGQDSGTVYLFDRDELGVWSAGGTLQASDVANEKQFGAAVAYRHSTLVVGSPEEGTIPGPGAVYFYTSAIFLDGFESGDLSAW